MNYRRSASFILLGTAAVFTLPGCMSSEKMKAEFKGMVDNRPVELDNYNMWVGTWEGTYSCTMMGDKAPTNSKGTSVVQWHGPDKRILVVHDTMEVPEIGTMKGVGGWNYDSSAKKYRMAWMDSLGMVDVGTGTYCPISKTWTMKSKSNWGTGTGTAKFIDANTIEWHWVARGPFWMKIMEMTGTSKRKS